MEGCLYRKPINFQAMSELDICELLCELLLNLDVLNFCGNLIRLFYKNQRKKIKNRKNVEITNYIYYNTNIVR